MKLTYWELRALKESATGPLHLGWHAKTMPRLEEKGFIEKRPMPGWYHGGAWIITRAGRAALQQKDEG